MSKRTLFRGLNSCSDNRKSKIQNLKWLGLSVLAFVLVVAGAVAEAQQPKKVPRIGWLMVNWSQRSEAFQEGLRELGYVRSEEHTSELQSLSRI